MTAAFLKYITPFGFCEGADIISNGCLNIMYVVIGFVFCVIGGWIACQVYTKKDIH